MSGRDSRFPDEVEWLMNDKQQLKVTSVRDMVKIDEETHTYFRDGRAVESTSREFIQRVITLEIAP